MFRNTAFWASGSGKNTLRDSCIFVSAMGMIVVILSVTGVVIWLRKSRARKRAGEIIQSQQ
ncbi:MAG: hypothetical protein ACT4NX_01795 [Deltaproteobacteria bacterium]